MEVEEVTVNEDAGTLPNLTSVAPEKLVPVILTTVLVPPLVGVNDVIVGAATYVNPANVAVPPGVATLTSPEAPAATTATIVVGETIVNDDAGIPPKLTLVAPIKPLPVIVTDNPLPEVVGVNEVIVGP